MPTLSPDMQQLHHEALQRMPEEIILEVFVQETPRFRLLEELKQFPIPMESMLRTRMRAEPVGRGIKSLQHSCRSFSPKMNLKRFALQLADRYVRDGFHPNLSPGTHATG